MALDSMSYIFQNLNGMYEFVGISTQTNQEGRLLVNLTPFWVMQF